MLHIGEKQNDGVKTTQVGKMKTSTDKLHPVVIVTVVVKMIKAGWERIYHSFSVLKISRERKDGEIVLDTS